MEILEQIDGEVVYSLQKEMHTYIKVSLIEI